MFRSTRISSNSSIAFCWLTSMHDPDGGSFIQRILCLLKVTSFQSSEPTWISFLCLAETRYSISVPPVPKRSSTNRSIIPTTDCCWTSCNGIQHVLKCTIVGVRRSILFPGSLTRLYGVQHITAPISSRRNHALTTQCLVKDVPPTSGGITHAICRFLESCRNLRRMACFWWQLTHHITIHIIRLSLKKCCFEINVKNVPSFAACPLATHPKSGSLWK